MRDIIKQFLQLESSSAILLFAAAILALALANSPIHFMWHEFVQHSHFLINEGLMAIFFLVVGLELKRGYLYGELSSLRQIALPAIAAIGGMLIPILIYLTINQGHPATRVGWSIPVATDIAFALGVLSVFGRRVPTSLKLFLLALAIFDDIGAILIITLFYSTGLSLSLLTLAATLVLILYLFNWFAVQRLLPYLLVGILLWLSLIHSGIHPTIAGVVLALMIPARQQADQSPLHRLEKTLHPWVAYGIMPLFALANAGLSFSNIAPHTWMSFLVLGIVLGLFVGKQIGVFLFSWVLIRLGFAKLPRNTSWLALYGVALLCGIGFTMSLFLGTLSFQNQSTYIAEVQLGVIIGSILSGLVGAIVLKVALARQERKKGGVID